MNDQYNWYETFFDGIILDFWQKAIPPAYTQGELDFIKSHAQLMPGDAILDMPCGYGRHTLPLAQEGFALTGIDISSTYILRLREAAREKQLAIETIQADIVNHTIDKTFDLAICMGNSIHYFDYPKMLAFLQKINAALNHGACFIAHCGALAEVLLPVLKVRNWMEVDDILYFNHNTYDPQESLLKTDYRFMKNGLSEMKTAYHYVISVAELKRMLAKAGFSKINFFGDVKSAPLKWGDDQAYLVAVK